MPKETLSSLKDEIKKLTVDIVKREYENQELKNSIKETRDQTEQGAIAVGRVIHVQNVVQAYIETHFPDVVKYYSGNHYSGISPSQLEKPEDINDPMFLFLRHIQKITGID